MKGRSISISIKVLVKVWFLILVFLPADGLAVTSVAYYEDAEDGLTVGWYIYDQDPAGASITNVFDSDREGKVIAFAGDGTRNGYRFRNSDGSLWHNAAMKVIQWSMKFDSSFVVYIDVQTSAGHRYLTYRPVDYDALGDDRYVYFGLGTNSRDGGWHTFARDLQGDLEKAQPGVCILEVNSFLIRGSGRVDDIVMSGSFPYELDSDGDGLSDKLELYKYGTSPYLCDTDHDRYPDKEEKIHWGDFWGADFDNDGKPNLLDEDADNDLVHDGVEASCGYDPGDPLSTPTTLAYEDAEDGKTDGWYVYDAMPEGAVIRNVIDEEHQGRVIEFAGDRTANGYRLRYEDGSYWRNRGMFVLEWSMKYDAAFVVYIDVQTTAGHRYLTYKASDDHALGDDRYVYFGLGSDADNGLWHTFIRDLQADLNAAQPGVEILEVNSFLIRGSGRVDDIRLHKSRPSDLDSDNDGISDSDEQTVYGTDPYERDSDSDGMDDGAERDFWGDDWSHDTDGDGLVNLLDPDSDNDGLLDGSESSAGSDPGLALTVHISVDPTAIDAGDTAILTWSSTDAVGCSIEPGIGDVSISGSVTVSPTVDTDYLITAHNQSGGTISAEAFVGVASAFSSISILAPDAQNNAADRSFMIQWVDDDPDDNAVISLYWDTDNHGQDGARIITCLPEDPDGAGNDEFLWDTTDLPDGDYYIYAVLEDEKNEPVVCYSGVPLVVRHNPFLSETSILANSGETGDEFGRAIDADGISLIAGVPGDDSAESGAGAAYIFQQVEDSWIEQQKLTAGGAEQGDSFGFSVAVQGDYAIVGAPYAAAGVGNSGKAYIFFRDASGIWSEQEVLEPGTASDEGGFGMSVALFDDWAVVGAPGSETSSGWVYLFRRSGTEWVKVVQFNASDGYEGDLFGSSVAIDYNQLVVVAPGVDRTDTGAAYVFEYDGAVWVERTKILPEGLSTHKIQSAAIDGERAIIGAYHTSKGNGRAYVFEKAGASWNETAVLQPGDPDLINLIGYSVSIESSCAAIAGLALNLESGEAFPTAYLFVQQGADWLETMRIDFPSVSEYSMPVEVRGGNLFAGAWREAGNEAGSGVVFVYGGLPLPQAKPSIDSLQAVPAAIEAGQTSTIMWETSNAKAAFLEEGPGCAPVEGEVAVSPEETTTYSLVAMGSSGVTIENVTVYVIDPMVSPVVEASASIMTIPEGGFALLQWTSSNALAVTIDNGIGDVPINGEIRVSPSQTTTYSITAANPAGSATGTITITVVPPPAIAFSADPESIVEGESALLVWNVTDADACSIEPGIGIVSSVGSTAVSPTQTTTYTLTAEGSGGTVSEQITVTVIPIPTAMIGTAEYGEYPDSIIQGGSTQLSWRATNADSCTIEPEIGSVAASGTITVSPTQTTTYTLTAIGAGGTATDSITITVIPLPTVSIDASQNSIAAGESIGLVWTSTDADTCTIEPGIGSVALNGSLTVVSDENTTYTIHASGPGGTVSDSVTVSVFFPPTASLIADQDAVVAGETIQLSWETANADSITIVPGIGSVTTTGSISVSPSETTTYTLTASGPAGTIDANVTVNVYDPAIAPLVNFTAPEVIISQGESANISWNSENASNAYIDNGIGEVALSGSAEVSPLYTTLYTITATSVGGSGNDTVLVRVLGDPISPPENSFGEPYSDLIPLDATVSSYDPSRFSLVSGSVRNTVGSPISHVVIKAIRKPEYGSVLSDENGEYTLPVEGGGSVTLEFTKEGYIPLHRKIFVGWNDFAVSESVVLVIEDEAATDVTFDGDASKVVTHRSTEVNDDSGTRSCTMVFRGDNQAYLVDEEGNDIQPLTKITARATEFRTPQSMPAALPPSSGFTYCVELSVDGAERVRFDQPVVTWTDNFIGFDVGTIVPAGYYDRERGEWIASENGVVVELLDTDGDSVVDALDVDGDGLPDDLDGNGYFSNEVEGLENPVAYLPGSTYWRVEIRHFTPWDFNWPVSALDGSFPPNPNQATIIDAQNSVGKVCNIVSNSFVSARSRVYHEDIPIAGTNISLHYASNRVTGYKPAKIDVPVSGSELPASLKSVVVELEVAGSVLRQELEPIPDQHTSFEWDGYDHLGRRVEGSLYAEVRVGYVYDGYYMLPSNTSRSFGWVGSSTTAIPAREDVVLWKVDQVKIDSCPPSGMMASGWTLSNHHSLDTVDVTTLYKGSGEKISDNIYMIERYAGTGEAGYDGDGGPADEAQFQMLVDLAVGPDGNVYLADYSNSNIRMVDRKGIVSTVLSCGDQVHSVALDDAGNLYAAIGHITFSAADNNRIIRMDNEGFVTTVAGSGNWPVSCTGDSDSAVQTPLLFYFYLTAGPDGSFYFSEHASSLGCYHLRKVDTSGKISTLYQWSGAVEADRDGNLYLQCGPEIRKMYPNGNIEVIAGTGTAGYSGDGGLAIDADINVGDLTVDDTGNVYFVNNWNGTNHIRKIDTSGRIYTFAGNGNAGEPGDGGPAVYSWLGDASVRLDVDQKGNIYLIPVRGCVVYKISMPKHFEESLVEADLPFKDKNGNGYILSSSGRHKRTFDLKTGVELLEFNYDENGLLATISDQFGNTTSIERNGYGVPAAIVSPDGIRTELTIDSDNHLQRITYGDGTFYEFEYSSNGLMTAEIDPSGNRFEHEFDADGRLADVIDEEGGHWQHSRTKDENGDFLTEITTGEGNVTTYLDSYRSTGEMNSVITGPSGDQTFYTSSADGTEINKQLACGMLLTVKNDLDPEYKYEYAKEITETAPEGLARQVLNDRTYVDTDGDTKPDLITETVAVNGITTTTVQDVLNSQTAVTSPEGRAVVTSYDPETLLTESVSAPGLYDMVYAYDSRGRLETATIHERETSYTYDGDGNLNSVTDGEDHTTTFDHDDLGRVTAVHRPDATDIFYAYDANGNMTVLTTPSDVEHDFSFNRVNLNDAYQTPLSGDYRYSYDRDRRLTEKTFPSGRQIVNAYSEDRLIQTRTPEGDIDFSYACGSKVESVTKGTEAITYEYDGKLVTSETMSGSMDQTLEYSYNNNFLPTGFSYAGQTETLSYDQDNLLTGSGAYTIFRNAQNGLPEEVAGGGLQISRQFNGYGEVGSQTVVVNGSELSTWTLARDNNGRITSRTETVGGTVGTYQYDYDPTGRIVGVTKGGALVEEYSYDSLPFGTCTYQVNTLRGIAGRELHYNDEDQLLSAGDVAYQYDLDGFLTSRTDGTETTTYTYSSRGELMEINLPNGTIVEYEHDPLGRRILKRVDGVVVEKYLWQGMTRLLAVYDGSDNLVMRFEYADERMPVAMTKGGETYYLIYDPIGSLRMVADSLGTVVRKIDYDTYGTVIADTNPTFDVPFGFAGGLCDIHTGLVRFGYRDYDPETGRWTAKDPILFAGGDTDLYGYVLSDPVNFIDPRGLKTWQIGLGFNTGGMVGSTKSAGIIIGHNPNTGDWDFGFYATGGAGLHGGASASLTLDITKSDNPCIDDVSGWAGTAGGSLNLTEIATAGYELNTPTSDALPSKTYSFGVGVGTTVEGHSYATYTKVWGGGK